jgi:hypothetical protein
VLNATGNMKIVTGPKRPCHYFHERILETFRMEKRESFMIFGTYPEIIIRAGL